MYPNNYLERIGYTIKMSSTREVARILKKMYEHTIRYNETMLSLLEALDEDGVREANTRFSYDIDHTFCKDALRYRVRESTDRLYYIRSLEEEVEVNVEEEEEEEEEEEIEEEGDEECEHEVIVDLVDIHPDKSVTIVYCKRCEKTFI